jgi:hypothetical protein
MAQSHDRLLPLFSGASCRSRKRILQCKCKGRLLPLRQLQAARTAQSVQFPGPRPRQHNDIPRNGLVIIRTSPGLHLIGQAVRVNYQ